MATLAFYKRNPDAWIVGVSFFTFAILGIPGALLGVAWSPYMRETFDLPRGAVGLLMAASTIGYFIASFNSGRLVAKLDSALLIALSCLISSLGILGYALSPAWALMIFLALFVGVGAGMVDSTLNIYFAAYYGPRLMNWLHASFGIGATLAPLLMNLILDQGGSWRIGYGIAAFLYAVAMGLFLLTRPVWKSLKIEPSAATVTDKKRHASTLDTLRLPIAWLGIGLFMSYAGSEASAGQWAFSLFNEVRHVSEGVARNWVSVYWGSFTVGRILFGIIVKHVKPSTIIHACLGVMVAGVGLLWWNPSNALGFAGLVIYGFALAPIFALMITNAQERLGPVHAPNAIGFQVAAASFGAGFLPGLAGLLSDEFGLEIISPFLMLLAILMILLYVAMGNPRFNQPLSSQPSIEKE